MLEWKRQRCQYNKANQATSTARYPPFEFLHVSTSRGLSLFRLPLCMVVGVKEQLFPNYMAHLNTCQPAIYTEQNHCYLQNPNFSTSSFNAIEQNQRCSLFSPNFSLFIASLSDRSDAQEWALTQHICSPCVAESHILFSLPKVTNIYFLLDSPTESLQQREKQVTFHSALLIKRSLLARMLPLLRECVNLGLCPE